MGWQVCWGVAGCLPGCFLPLLWQERRVGGNWEESGRGCRVEPSASPATTATTTTTTTRPYHPAPADRGGVFLLAATNRPEALDPALLRPGRLDRLLRVPLPDAAARASILASRLARCPLGADVDLAELAGEATRGMSGADLAEVCRRAGTAAIRELVAAERSWAQQQEAAAGGAAAQPPPQAPPLRQRHLVEALAGMRRSVSAGESERHARIERRLREGSLTEEEAQEEGPGGGGGQQRERQAVLRRVMQQAVQGGVQRQVGALQERVRQLEAALRGAGLAVPPPPAAP